MEKVPIKKHKERGTLLIELCIVFPVFVIIVFGVLEIQRWGILNQTASDIAYFTGMQVVRKCPLDVFSYKTNDTTNSSNLSKCIGEIKNSIPISSLPKDLTIKIGAFKNVTTSSATCISYDCNSTTFDNVTKMANATNAINNDRVPVLIVSKVEVPFMKILGFFGSVNKISNQSMWVY